MVCYGLRVKMSISQLLRYFVAFLIDSISNGYTPITKHELKPWVFFAFNLDFEKWKLNFKRHLELRFTVIFTRFLFLANFDFELVDVKFQKAFRNKNFL